MSFWAYMVLQVAKRFTTSVVVVLIVLGVHGFASCGLGSGSIQFIFVFNLVTYSPLKFGDYVYPGWGQAIG